MPKTSSEDRLSEATENLVEILQKSHPPTPFLDQGTKTNDAIRELQKIFKPIQKQNGTTRMTQSAARVQGAATRVQLPTIEENEIRTVIRKRYNTAIHNGEVTPYYTDENLYFISYENGENEKINQRQLNRYRCTDRDRDTTRRITRLQTRLHQANVAKEMNKAYARTGAKLPAHFANAVFDEDTGQMLDYKKLINHNKKETREWWQQSSANEFGRLMKGAGRNKDGTQRVTGSDTFHFIHKKNVPKGKKITYARFCCDVRL